VIHYSENLASVRADMLHGFFAGWPQRPSPEQHLAVLLGSHRSVVALDDVCDRVVGFVNMLSDGMLTAFIPWLEVLPPYQGNGIGTELTRRILESAENLYSVDLLCDPSLVPFYARFGMSGATGALLRRPTALGSPPPAGA
jgi:GNAT superfamily N-acetyltransferase